MAQRNPFSTARLDAVRGYRTRFPPNSPVLVSGFDGPFFVNQFDRPRGYRSVQALVTREPRANVGAVWVDASKLKLIAGYKVCWRKKPYDPNAKISSGSAEIECTFGFRTLRNAEEFAAARSKFRAGIVSVEDVKGGSWITLYQAGFLKDANRKGSFIPPEQVVRIERKKSATPGTALPKVKVRGLRNINRPIYRYEEHAARHANDSFTRGRVKKGRTAGPYRTAEGGLKKRDVFVILRGEEAKPVSRRLVDVIHTSKPLDEVAPIAYERLKRKLLHYRSYLAHQGKRLPPLTFWLGEYDAHHDTMLETHYSVDNIGYHTEYNGKTGRDVEHYDVQRIR